MNKIDLLTEFKDMLNHNLFFYLSDYLMNTPKKQYVKEWEKTQEKIKLVDELIEQEEEELE